MKLPSSDTTTETSGLLLSREFSIGDAGIILEILRTKIYTNPILAICREYCNNARDAHREVGTPDRPIEVYLPNHWSSNLRIKDFGPGIDPTRMEDIFIKFGCSTKRQDNSQHGGFGLGCKTGFSYSDTFTVITAVDGTEYTYSAYIDETKVGKMTLLQKVATTEPNGTEIKIPITTNDSSKFINTIIKATQYWDVKPILHGEAPNWEEISYVYEGVGWGLPASPAKSSYSYAYSSYKDLTAIIDGTAYSVTTDSLGHLTETQKSIIRNGFHLTFNVGELSLAASRDSIHFDENTQKLIISRIDKLAEELVALITNNISSSLTYVDACNAYICSAKHIKKDLIDSLQGIAWNGHVLRSTATNTEVGRWSKLITYRLLETNRVTSSTRDGRIDFLNYKTALYHFDLKNKFVPGFLTKHILQKPDIECIQIIHTEDLPTNSGFLNATRQAIVYSKDPPVVAYDMELAKLLGFKSLQEELDKAPKPVKERAKRVKGASADDGEIIGYRITNINSEIRALSRPISNVGGCFIEVDYKKNDFTSGGVPLTSHALAIYERYLNIKVVGFSEFRIKKLNDTWIPLIDAVKAQAKCGLKDISIVELNKAALASNYLLEFLMPDMVGIIKLIPQNSLLVKYATESDKVSNLLKKHSQFMQILSLLHEDIACKCESAYSVKSGAAPKNELNLLHQSVIEQYPLLTQVKLRYENNKIRDAVIEYINLIENSLKRTSKTKINTETISADACMSA